MGYFIAGAALLAALVLVVWDRVQLARTMNRLDEMLTCAMNGSFCEKHFDESRLSALESRLNRYLTASDFSARTIQMQKDEISRLISDISHQTKTPVANLCLYAQLLEEQSLSAEALNCAHAIEAQAQKLQSLIEILVKSSRLETGILALHPQENPLGPMVQRAVEQFRLKAQEKEIGLTCENVQGTAVFDPKWTEEALCNLVDNALKYTPRGGQVHLAVRMYEMFCAVCVSDSGPGIPEDEQAKIFGRFYRSPEAYSKEGVGIGLYLTRQIAEKQSGYLKVESTLGKGSCFCLFLPRDERCTRKTRTP